MVGILAVGTLAHTRLDGFWRRAHNPAHSFKIPFMRFKLRHSAAAALVAVLVVVLGACAVPPQPDLAARAPGLPSYGQVEWTVSTASPAAQRPYTQGAPQAYALHEVEAVRMFTAALAQDPNCVMGLGRGLAARAHHQQHQPQRRQGSAAPPGPRTAPRHRHAYRHQYQYQHHATATASAAAQERALIEAISASPAAGLVAVRCVAEADTLNVGGWQLAP